MSEPLSFTECLYTAANTPTFVAEFDRLAGTHLSEMGVRAPLDAMIDEATGRDAEALRQFVEFVWEYVYLRLPPTDSAVPNADQP